MTTSREIIVRINARCSNCEYGYAVIKSLPEVHYRQIARASIPEKCPNCKKHRMSVTRTKVLNVKLIAKDNAVQLKVGRDILCNLFYLDKENKFTLDVSNLPNYFNTALTILDSSRREHFWRIKDGRVIIS